jgi:hypothetical protein
LPASAQAPHGDRERTLAAEVQAYREEVSKLAASSDPAKQKALQRFADGERAAALDELKRTKEN